MAILKVTKQAVLEVCQKADQIDFNNTLHRGIMLSFIVFEMLISIVHSCNVSNWCDLFCTDIISIFTRPM